MMTTATEVINMLRHPGLRVRTGLWLLPPDQLEDLPDRAARLGIGYADLREPVLAAVLPEQRFLRFDVPDFIEALDSLCRGDHASGCLLVANGDLLAAKLGYNERRELWDTLYSGYPYRQRAVIMALPARATALLPGEQQLDLWRRDGRLIS
jgi:hypothetical protein